MDLTENIKQVQSKISQRFPNDFSVLGCRWGSVAFVVWCKLSPVHTEKTVKDKRLKRGFKTGENNES